MNLKDRVDRLEEKSFGRCKVCFLTREIEGTLIPEPPEICPHCGYEPRVVVVRRTYEAGRL
jgi:hypothetical protein